MVIGTACQVKMHYTLKLDNGEVLETTQDGEPVEFEFGAGSIIPGLEKELEGMAQGDEKHVVVEPDDGYGPRNPEALVKVSREEFPAEGPLEPGMMFQMNREDGVTMHVTVVGEEGGEVTLDLNHPLAGEKLHFDIKIAEISPAAEKTED